MTIKLQLYGYKEVHDAIIESVKSFQDPKNPGPLIYNNNVRKSLPGRDKLSLYGGVLGHVSLNEVPTITDGGVGEEVASITGELYTWIAGRDSESMERCEYYCDISRAYFKNGNLLDLPGSYITTPKNYPNRFTKINLADVAKKPIYYTVGSTGFLVEKDLDSTVYTI